MAGGAGIKRANPVEIGLGYVASLLHEPAAGSQATITAAAPGIGFRNICLGFTVTFLGSASAPAAALRSVRLIDGASGGTTYLWGTRLAVPATAGTGMGATREGWWRGSENTALTLEFDSGLANAVQTVEMEVIVGPISS